SVLERLVPEGPMVDVGSGGGFPGMVTAIVFPERAVVLVEPLQKRARLLSEMSVALGLGNVAVHPLRAEEVGRGALRESAGVVTARAVAPLRELLEYTLPIARRGGLLLLAKGSRLDDEVSVAAGALRELGGEIEGIVPMRDAISPEVRLLCVRKVAETPQRYPR